AHVARWRRYLFWDVSIGIGGNLLTTLMTCLLAYALLFPKGLLPQGYELAVVQSRFFEVSWGGVGRIFFLIVPSAFLSDTWFSPLCCVRPSHFFFFFGFFPKKTFFFPSFLFFFFSNDPHRHYRRHDGPR